MSIHEKRVPIPNSEIRVYLTLRHNTNFNTNFEVMLKMCGID